MQREGRPASRQSCAVLVKVEKVTSKRGNILPKEKGLAAVHHFLTRHLFYTCYNQSYTFCDRWMSADKTLVGSSITGPHTYDFQVIIARVRLADTIAIGLVNFHTKAQLHSILIQPSDLSHTVTVCYTLAQYR